MYKRQTGEKYREIARAMGVQGVDSMTQEEYRKAAIDAVRKLSEDVGIPADLKAIVKEEDIPFLSLIHISRRLAAEKKKIAFLCQQKRQV